MKRVFVTGTGTNVGKSLVSRGIAAAVRASGSRVTAVKPIETGVIDAPADATALADACGNAKWVMAPGFYRKPRPLAPYACTLLGDSAPKIADIVVATFAASQGSEFTIVEGAGGVLSPIDETHSMAELAALLDARCVLVARDELGTLSQAECAVESLQKRHVPIACVVLTQRESRTPMNPEVLGRRLAPLQILTFDVSDESTEALAREANRSGLIRTLLNP